MQKVTKGTKIGKFIVKDFIDDGETVIVMCANCGNEKEKNLQSFLRVAPRLNCIACRGKRGKKKHKFKNPLENTHYRENMEKHGMSQAELDEEMNKESARNLTTGIKNIVFTHWGNKYYWQVAVQHANFIGQVRLDDAPDALDQAKQIKRQMIASIKATPEGEDWRMDAWKVKNYALNKKE